MQVWGLIGGHLWARAGAGAAVDDRLDHLQPDVVYVWNIQGVSKSLLFNLQNQVTPIAYNLHDHWLSPHLFLAMIRF